MTWILCRVNNQLIKNLLHWSFEVDNLLLQQNTSTVELFSKSNLPWQFYHLKFVLNLTQSCRKINIDEINWFLSRNWHWLTTVIYHPSVGLLYAKLYKKTRKRIKNTHDSYVYHYAKLLSNIKLICLNLCYRYNNMNNKTLLLICRYIYQY